MTSWSLPLAVLCSTAIGCLLPPPLAGPLETSHHPLPSPVQQKKERKEEEKKRKRKKKKKERRIFLSLLSLLLSYVSLLSLSLSIRSMIPHMNLRRSFQRDPEHCDIHAANRMDYPHHVEYLWKFIIEPCWLILVLIRSVLHNSLIESLRFDTQLGGPELLQCSDSLLDRPSNL